MPFPQSSYSIQARGGFDARRMRVAFGTPALQSRISLGEPTTPGMLVAPTASPTVSDVPLVSNARGASVAALQSLLASWGFSPGPIDGILGPQTITAINAAWVSLGASASSTVREKVTNNWMAYGNVGALLGALNAALQTDAMLTGRKPLGQAPVAAAPSQAIQMSAVDARDVQVELGLQPKSGVPAWAWWLLGGGVALAAVGAVAASRKRRR